MGVSLLRAVQVVGLPGAFRPARRGLSFTHEVLTGNFTGEHPLSLRWTISIHCAVFWLQFTVSRQLCSSLGIRASLPHPVLLGARLQTRKWRRPRLTTAVLCAAVEGGIEPPPSLSRPVPLQCLPQISTFLSHTLPLSLTRARLTCFAPPVLQAPQHWMHPQHGHSPARAAAPSPS